MRFIRSTGQLWKFAILSVVTAAGGAAILFQFELANLLHVDDVFVALVALAFVVFAFVTMLITVRCPNCGLRLVWYSASKKDSRVWFTWLMSLDRCPACGCVGV